MTQTRTTAIPKIPPQRQKRKTLQASMSQIKRSLFEPAFTLSNSTLCNFLCN